MGVDVALVMSVSMKPKLARGWRWFFGFRCDCDWWAGMRAAVFVAARPYRRGPFLLVLPLLGARAGRGGGPEGPFG